MTPSEIITQEAKQVGYDADIMLRKINKLVQGKAGVLLQQNNSLMLLIGIGKAVSEAHFFIADDKATLKKSMAHFAEQLKNSELNTIYGTVDKQHNPLLENAFDLLHKNKINIQKSNVPRYLWMAQLKGAA